MRKRRAEPRAVERDLSDAIAGALLSTRRGWTTTSLALTKERVLAAIKPIVKREVRRARGKTVLHAIVDRDPLSGDWMPYSWLSLGTRVNRRMTRMIGKAVGVRREVATVVLRPARSRR